MMLRGDMTINLDLVLSNSPLEVLGTLRYSTAVHWPVPSRRKPAGTGEDVLPVLSAASPATPQGQLANVASGLAAGVAWLGLSGGGAHLASEVISTDTKQW